jgi:ATP-dependent Lon protease
MKNNQKNKSITHIKLNEFDDFETDRLIPIIPGDTEDQDFEHDEVIEVPILPIKNTVLFPGVVIPITVGRQKAIRLVRKANNGDKIIGVVSQNNTVHEDPGVADIFQMGTLAKILRLLILPDGNTTIIIQGRRRFQIEEIVKTTPFLTGRIRILHDKLDNPKKRETVALDQSLREAATKILRLNPEIPQEAQDTLNSINSPVYLTYFLSSNLNADVREKQTLLETNDINERATRLLELLLKEIQILELKHEITNKVHSDIDQQQRDYFLRQQMKVLQEELGIDGPDQEIERLKSKALAKTWPNAPKEHFLKELVKLGRMNPASAEYPILLNYCELLVELPWDTITTDVFDLEKAQKILDSDHYGLEKVKDRIIEFLAVLKLKESIKGPILCLFGPPGVGKTSLGKSIAKALNRSYIRMSLGGLRDEAEIRGHRKTYVGAMPGRIIQSIKKAGTSNPVFILDEIDKIGADFRGDPSSALLEVLDPEQNNAFLDNYLEVEYDLSKVLFIATANSLDTIHPALRDRMEIIEVNGYTLEEKIEIAKSHLIPKLRKEHGLNAKQLSFDAQGLRAIIEGYTRESGVRNLERKLASVIRNVARSVASEQPYQKKINQERVEQILGAPIFDNEIYTDNETAGVVTGLAWTQTGGEILFIESSLHKGKGRLTLSGQLGEVMKESAGAALSYLKAHASDIKLDYRVFDQYDLHIHVPAGAVPKDGPSAGITMLTSIASAYTQRKVKSHLAMTGEITLTGKVLPVGGIKEKLLAARRAGIKELILCRKNRKDVEEIAERYKNGLVVHFVDNVREVLELSLLPTKVNKPLVFELDDVPPQTAKPL